MRIVVKIGTSTLAHPGGRLNIRHTEALVKVWSDIKNAGHELIIVSSGATGLGVGKLQISRPKDMVTKQAAAAVGQCELMYTYDKLFAEYSHTVAQLLVTWEDFDHPHRLNNLQNTLERLIQLGAVPVINENDPISTEEYSLGDNDRLGALIAKYTHADLLVLLSDIDGLYTADPHTHPEATLIHRVESVTPEIEQLGGGSNSALNLRLAELIGLPFSIENVLMNLCLFVPQLLWGRRYIGLGTIINSFCIGFIVTFTGDAMTAVFGSADTLPVQLLWVAVAVLVIALGCSLYQTADLGVAPYDALSLMLADRLPVPYFGCRVFTDALCAVLAFLLGGLIGLGTLICAFGLGPFVQFFTRHFSEKVLRYKPEKK